MSIDDQDPDTIKRKPAGPGQRENRSRISSKATNQALLISASSKNWMKWLNLTSHDFYHTDKYHHLAESNGEGEPFLAVYGDSNRFMAWPYLLRDIDPSGGQEERGTAEVNYRDVTSVYGYPGPLFHGCESDYPFIRNAWGGIREAWKTQKVVSAFTRFHPLLKNHKPLQGAIGMNDLATNGQLFLHGHTVSIDTQQTEPDAIASYTRTVRQEIARSRRLGVFTNIEYDWDNLVSFIDIYIETMMRNGASRYYHFDYEYFDRLKEATKNNAFLIVARLDRRIIAGCIILAYNRMLHVHLGGTRTEFLKLSPFKILFDDLRIWARDHGFVVLHLGGGRGSNDRDSLFSFKSEFSKRRHKFHTGHWILDRAAYSKLCQSRGPCALPDPDIATDKAGFFPAYRAPHRKQHSQCCEANMYTIPKTHEHSHLLCG